MAISDLSYLHAAGDGGLRPRTQLIVIHATDNTAAASAEASYATRRPDKTSAHFYVDDNAAFRALPLGNIAYGCLYHGNQISVQLELCGRSNAITDATMRRAAGIVAELCQQYGLPAVKVSAAQVRNGSKGVCGHVDITAAFPEDGGDHTDPGLKFDWAKFIGYIQQAADTTAAFEEDDMDAKQDASLKWTDGRMASTADMTDNYVDPAGKPHPNQLVAAIKKLQADMATLKAAVTKLSQPQVNVDAAALAGLPKPPTAAEIADELAKRIGNG